MSNLHDVRPPVIAISLDRERHLCFDLNAFATLEEKFGDMQSAFAALQGGSMRAARTLLWAGLVHEDESLTERQVGGYVTLDKIQRIVELLTAAIQAALPEADADDGGAGNG